MKRFTTATLIMAMSATTLLAKDPDPRLATVRKVFIAPIDELGDDREVALCFAEALPRTTPMEVVATRGEADVILMVKAHIPSATSRYALGAMGGSPSADVYAELPDGTKLWNDGAKVRRGNLGKQVLTKGKGETGSIECSVAQELAGTVRDAMRKARDKK